MAPTGRPLTVCARKGCGNLVPRGYCDACRKDTRPPKLSAHRRGYTAEWEEFRLVTFPNLLLDQGITPKCGARLAAGPSPHSRCAAAGIVTMTGLELHHEPPLEPWERAIPERVCDPMRVEFLCKSDHSAVRP